MFFMFLSRSNSSILFVLKKDRIATDAAGCTQGRQVRRRRRAGGCCAHAEAEGPRCPVAAGKTIIVLASTGGVKFSGVGGIMEEEREKGRGRQRWVLSNVLPVCNRVFNC